MSVSCQLMNGQPLPCKNWVAGISRVYFINFYTGATTTVQNLSYTANSSNQISAMTITSGGAYEFANLKEATDNPEGWHSTPSVGTNSYENNLTMFVPQYSTEVRNLLITLSTGKFFIVVLDRNGQYWLLGSDGTGSILGTSAGCDMVESTATLGKAFATDPNGYTLVFNSIERVPPLEILPSALAPWIVTQ